MGPIPLRDRARGRWRDILRALGVPAKALSGKNCPCPFQGCGGKDRFRWTNLDGRGTFFCSACQPGDGVEMAMRFTGLDFRACAEKIEGLLGATKMEPVRELSEERRLELCGELWGQGAPIPGTPVERWFDNRFGLKWDMPHNIRCWWSPRGGPVMIARLLAPEGKFSTLHRTHLTEAGEKANVSEVRKLMPGGSDVLKGAAVRLYRPTEGGILGIAEGIETAMAAKMIFGIPTWSAISAWGLENWEPPLDAKCVHIFADNDESFTGQAAAYALAKRLSTPKYRDRGLRQVQVHVPPLAGTDWNDELLRKVKAQPKAAE